MKLRKVTADVLVPKPATARAPSPRELKRRELEAAPDPEAKRLEMEKHLIEMSSVLRGGFGGIDIIDPRDTRPLLVDFVRHAQEITATKLGPKSRVGIRP